jgi:DNA-binding MarR family transcriptional regulator
MVDRLVERGILCRERSRQDRRKVAVRVSEDVAEDIRRIEEKILSAFIDIIEKLGPDATRKWCEVLVQVERILCDKPDPEDPAKTERKR